MRTFWVVFTDSNQQQVEAFFASQATAIAWRDANFPAGDVWEARIDKYERVNVAVVDF